MITQEQFQMMLVFIEINMYLAAMLIDFGNTCFI